MDSRVRRSAWIVSVLFAAMLLLVACGSTPEPTATPVPVEPTQAAPEPTEGPVADEPTEAPTAAEPTAPPQEEVLLPSEKPSAVRGRAVYQANCTSCHGALGDGSGFSGAANFTDADFVRSATPARFFQSIYGGLMGGKMPAWGDKLTGMEIWDVLYYERAFATSPEQVAQGQTLFDANCTSCHGQAGDGSGLPGAANFTDQAFMSHKTEAELFASITKGVSGSAMPAWGETFSENEIWALVNYVWTFAYEYPGQVEPTPEPTETGAPATTPLPTAAEPTDTPEPTATQAPDPALGAQLWLEKPCSGCHGPDALGDIGPRLAGTTLNFDEVLFRVRTGKAPMPAFTEDQVSDQELRNIYAWLESLTPPTPTPEPDQPTPTPGSALPPEEHLTAFWEHVNWVKVHSDFAKDASPNIEALHGRVSQAIEEGNGALQEADLAIADIPNAQAQATIRQVKGFISEILNHANAALATSDLNAARGEAAKMVEISRLDAWPRASLAVKQAGFSGSVSVRVRNQSGAPFQGALVTALTAPNPTAGITDANGQVTLSGLAAVRVMQVKAYADGLVYHEVHVTVPAGGRASADITLPGPSAGGQTPAVSNPSISPSSGAGNAQVTFRMTGTDPQGHDNIAEDQVFALNPNLGVGYVLRSAGGDNWELTVALPNLPPGTHTWYFLIVDHQCNTSNIVPLTYTVQ